MLNERAGAVCEDVVQIYPSASGPVHALRGIDAEFARGSISIVAGPSGAGKSTFLRALACLERPAAGEVWIDGDRTAHLSGRRRRRLVARRIGYVFQRPSGNLLDYLSVAEHAKVALVMRDADRRGAVDELLEAVGLRDRADRRPGDLSAGEQQRLAFTMAVAGNPALVIADEPTAELDDDGTRSVVEFLTSVPQRGQTFVLSSHDPAVMAIADQTYWLRNGSLASHAIAGDAASAVVDSAGRILLPDQARELFPDGRASLTVDDDEVRLRWP